MVALEETTSNRTSSDLGCCNTLNCRNAVGVHLMEGAISEHRETVFCELPKCAPNQLGQIFLPLMNIDESSGEPQTTAMGMAVIKRFMHPIAF